MRRIGKVILFLSILIRYTIQQDRHVPAVHQAMMSRYGDGEHPMPVLLDQLSGGDAGSGLARAERGSVFHLREGDPWERGETD